MANANVNKVTLSNGTTLIDLTTDTVTSSSHIIGGRVGHLADGSQVTGTAEVYNGHSVTYSMQGGAHATATPARAVHGESFTSRIKVPAGRTLQGITVTMGGVDITSQVVEYDEIEEEPHAITYALTNGATANVTPAKVLADEGFSVRLTVPTGYNLSDVSVTMGGVDVTASVFEYD